MTDLLKLLAPYITTIASAIALYASFQTRLGVLDAADTITYATDEDYFYTASQDE